MSRQKQKTRLIALACLTVVSVSATWMLSRTRFFSTIELKTLDYRFRLLGRQGSASPEIVLAEIDDNSIKHLEPVFGRWPWSREVHGYFLRFMRRAGVRAVVFDVLFTEKDVTNPDGDEVFARETRGFDRVIQGVFLGDQDNEQVTGPVDPDLLRRFTLPDQGHFPRFIQVDLPYPALVEASVRLGHTANALDADGPFRHYLLLASAKGRLFPSLALSTALAADGLGLDDIRIEGRTVRAGPIEATLNDDWRLPIWFNGGPGTYQTYSYSHIVYAEGQIEQGEQPGLDPELFRDKIVLVGVSATGLHDMFTTPYAGTAAENARTGSGLRLGAMAGVEVHANVLDDLLHNRYLSKPARWITWIIGLLITALVLVAVFFTRLWRASVVALVLLGGYLWSAQFVFGRFHYQLPVATAFVGWSLALGFGLAYQYWIEGAEKRQVKAIFSRYVSKDVFQELMDDPEKARLGGVRTVVTVLFSDLRGFTTMSENREPEDIVAQLNEYFSAMVELVFEHQGTIDKFVGDMVMALFNAPVADPEHADHALQCALAMQKRLAELNVHWQERGLPTLACGVGVNTGEMIAGNVGAETIQSYTVIGDNVNLGARLESLCKEYKARIIISEFTRDLLAGTYDLKELGDVLVKGKSKPVKIFEVHVTDA